MDRGPQGSQSKTKKKSKPRHARLLDLFSDVPQAQAEEIEQALAEALSRRKDCITDYNELMEKYESGKIQVQRILMLLGDTDPGLFQHLPLFCWHFGIPLAKTHVSVRHRFRTEPVPPLLAFITGADRKG